MGHHVLSDLGLLGHFKEGIEAKAKEVDGISEAQAKRWRAWTEEIVADVVSVLLMGTWAVWAVAEVECSTTERMLRHKKDYPAPAVRLALLSHAALRQGFDENEGLRGISIAELAKQQPELAPWFAAVKPVVEFVLGELPDRLGTLASLCDTNRAELEKDVKWWSDQLTREELPNVPPELETARNVAAASLSAWSRAIDESMDATERQKKIKHLAKSTTEMLQKSGPPGTRGADQPSGVRKADGEALARELMASSRRRRESETPE